MKITSAKTQLLSMLSVGACVIAAAGRDPRFLGAVIVSVVTAAAIDAAAGWIKTKRFVLPESACISGLIIGYVLASDQPRWMFGAAAATAIASKHLIRARGRHILNPAAFGVCAVILLCHAATQWRVTYEWAIMAPAGLYLAWRIRKLRVLVGYLLVTGCLFGFQAVSQRMPLVSVFGFMSYFFIGIMLIEPKTSPARPWAQYVFGAGAGILIFVFTQGGIRFDAELLSLLLMNAAVPLLNLIKVK